MLNGSCLCGAITFKALRAAREPMGCHCTQCRKQSGHYWATVQVMNEDLEIMGSPQWYSATPIAKRGFCPTCGSFLFWKGEFHPDTFIALGALDGPTGLHMTRHIFTADKGDYYDIPDHVGQEDQEDD